MYSFQPDVAFEENISKSYFYQCHNMYSNCQFWQGHSYRRDIVSMIWLPQLWSGDSPRQHTHVCVQFLSRCFRFQLSRKLYISAKLEWVSSWKGVFSCTFTSYGKTKIATTEQNLILGNGDLYCRHPKKFWDSNCKRKYHLCIN